MSATVLQDPGLYAMLIAIDDELTAARGAQGCPHCGAKLHDGGFPPQTARVPRAVPDRLLAADESRLFALPPAHDAGVSAVSEPTRLPRCGIRPGKPAWDDHGILVDEAPGRPCTHGRSLACVVAA